MTLKLFQKRSYCVLVRCEAENDGLLFKNDVTHY